MKKLVGALLLMALGVVTFGLVFWLGMRTNNRVVVDGLRTVNKRFTNPRMLETAGRPGAAAAVIEHVGRTSGTVYRTPVGAVPSEDGFVIPLPYRTRSDWLKNVLASGSATLTFEGYEIPLERPELVPMVTVEHLFDENDRKVHQAFGIQEALRLRAV